jgi:hypothetical protein
VMVVFVAARGRVTSVVAIAESNTDYGFWRPVRTRAEMKFLRGHIKSGPGLDDRWRREC